MEQGMLAWDLVRVLSIVGGAYMGGIMEYKEAVKIAFEACKRLQENFTSWDDMVANYTLGYQFWRDKRQKDTEMNCPRDTCAGKERYFIGKGCPGREQQGK